MTRETGCSSRSGAGFATRWATRRFRLGNDLRRALERREFRLHYQPIVALASGQTLGCEALVRWQHPEHGLVEPATFLAVAEETGIITDIDWWVLDASCRQLSRWQRRLGPRAALSMHVNLDERQLADRAFVPELSRLVRTYALDPRRIALEVT